MVDKKAPELRFKGFTEDWEQCKLGEEVDIFDGTHQTPEYTDEGVKFVSVENISTLETKKYISLTAYEQEYHKKQAEKGDVLMTRIGDVGTSKVIDTAEPLAYYVTLALLKPKEITSDFLAWLIESPEVQRNIWKRTLHIAFPKKINLGEINQIDIFLPNIDEQLKIGDFLKRLDYTITLHQRKLEAMKQLKQAYLQQLFPSDGGDIPKVRFANFNRDWELCKFSDLVSRQSKTTDSTQLPSIEFEDIISGEGRLNKNISNKLDNRKGILFEPEYILYGKLRPYLKNWFFSDIKGKAIGDFWIFKANNTYPLFIYYLIQAKQFQQVANDTSGTKMPRSDWKLVSNTYFYIPKLSEQMQIANFLKYIDKTINLHQHKLESLNKLKQAYLQKMFI